MRKEVLGITNKSMEKDREIVIKKIYDLGFEVGHNNHSEIGWVLREYDDLIARALKMGIKSPDSYYADGKIKGKAGRDKNIEGQKAPEKATVVLRKFDVLGARIDFPDRIEEVHRDTPLGRPSMNDFPSFVRKGKASEAPGLLEGFKPIKKNRH
jgi:hypothetical protein